MSHKKYILPIFLLYTITSTMFLVFFAALYYHNAKEDIFKKTAKDMRSFANEIEFMLKVNGGTNEILNLQSEYEINLFDLRAKEFIVKSFDKPKFNDRFYSDENFMYYSSDIHTRRRAINLILDIRTQNPMEQLNELKIKITIISLFVLLFISVIAYFIVKLSYLPLLRQIKTLNNFITDTTHEINTPLSVILMSVEMFEKNPQKYLENIKIASKTLSNLYNDLALNLKSEPNQLKNINVKDVVLESVKIFEMSATNKNIKFNLNLEDIKLNSDQIKLKKIIDNLISNAVKYSFKDKTIDISLNAKNFQITNYGETIKKENLSKIYDKFRRFDTQNGGFGIGLSLVKRYCDELGFDISCQSDSNKTEFSVKFNK
ncbi:two-component system sensor histidine kinase [Campylobacter iguaniorum]|uniref:histidine kinase n=1 Tax=Campylobacter iguaniorum TaxID=1244531 RepID=A0A076FB29_9BACT|nr:HAMP domain-containing sensor histidine kinase [Campylobacter iguaniorum]AII14868.1 two-component system sensor histidine kinase [Campylobacter iguaniorum]ALV24658.1 two-component system sensor histidine kinase [Campylobacter iguaniorum]